MAYPITMDYDLWQIGTHLVPDGEAYRIMRWDYRATSELFRALDLTKPQAYGIGQDIQAFIIIGIFMLLMYFSYRRGWL